MVAYAFLDMRQGRRIGYTLVALTSAAGLVLAKDCMLLSLCKQIPGIIFGQHI
jgi:hypothetical protein